ncbi:hypothetical protein [Streptomyces sp. Ag109_O5-10]|uniref:hypothetical protein n=1 Tax=Streptomyces sp. Ag109_O5-10 TaxID=1855349 RepID=UPI0008977573|nr:hypothetical protein [Streptomyces sp. Ag109_O5-10]SEF07817.1 hypothetical protein SAMN05216533_5966 [Streptomyces sp. Ag109_O5-10]
MATIPSLPGRADVLRMARSTTDITGQLLDTAQNLTRIAISTLDPREGSAPELLRVLRRTTAELAEASAAPGAQEAFYRVVETLTRLGTSGAPLAVHPVAEPLLTALRDSLLPLLDAVEPAVQEFAAALRELTEALSPLLPAAAGGAAGVLLALTPLLRTAAETLRDSAPELHRIADALTSAVAPLLPLQTALAERATAAGAGVVRAALPPLADLTEAAAKTVRAAGPALIAAEELAVTGLEHLQPVLLASAAGAGRVARATAVRVSAAVSPAADRGVVVAVTPA